VAASVEPPIPPVTPSLPEDLSGYIVHAGETVDLKGKVYNVTTKPIACLKGSKLVNGTINNLLPKAIGGTGNPYGFAAIEIPSGADNVTIDNISGIGTSYNGLLKCWGNNLTVIKPAGSFGLGWLIQLIGVQGATIKGPQTNQLRRGGIYVDAMCNSVTIDDGKLVDSGEESPIRFNGGTGHLVSDTLCDMTKAVSAKESIQLRGGEGTIRGCTLLGNTASGQTPNGTPMQSKWAFKKCTIYGGNREEAGAVLHFLECHIVNQPSFVFDGVTYTPQKNRQGEVINYNGEAVSLQPAKPAVGLAKAVVTLEKSVIDVAPGKISGGIKPILVNCVDENGVAV
jgi:hypothetical protein